MKNFLKNVFIGLIASLLVVSPTYAISIGGAGSSNGDQYVGTGMYLDDVPFTMGASEDSVISWNRDQTIGETLVWGLGNLSNTLIFTQAQYISSNLGYPGQADPTVTIFSATDPATATDQWLSMTYESASGIGLMKTGTGSLVFAPATITQIGTGHTPSSLTGIADSMLIGGELEIDGTVYFDGTVVSGSGFVQTGTGSFGSITIGGSVADNATGSGSLFVSGDAEVDGTFYSDGGIEIASNEELGLGNLPNSIFKWDTTQNSSTTPTVVWGIGNSAKSVILTTLDKSDKDFDHAAEGDPTLFIQSYTDPDTANDEWGSLSYDPNGGAGYFELATGSGYVSVGAGAADSFDGDVGDLFVKSELEVDGTAYFDGLGIFATDVKLEDDVTISFGDNADSLLDWSTAQATNNTLVWGLGDGSKSIVFTTEPNINKDFDHVGQSDPTIFLHSGTDPDTANDEYLSMYYDPSAPSGGTAYMSTGSGSLIINPYTVTIIGMPSVPPDHITSISNSLFLVGALELDNILYADDDFNLAGTGAFAGSQIVGTKTINTATYTVLTTDYFLNVQYTLTGTGTLTLPTDITDDGRTLHIKDFGGNAATYPIIIETEGAEQIDGAANFTISEDFDSIGLVSDGSGWYVF